MAQSYVNKSGNVDETDNFLEKKYSSLKLTKEIRKLNTTILALKKNWFDNQTSRLPYHHLPKNTLVLGDVSSEFYQTLRKRVSHELLQTTEKDSRPLGMESLPKLDTNRKQGQHKRKKSHL